MTTTLPLNDIIVEDRLRKNYGDIETLADDITQNGLIQPIVLTLQPDGTHRLVAGGRRFAAIRFAKYESVTHGVTCDPQKPGFVYSTELPPERQREIELAENLQRLDMDWRETVLGVCEIHTLYKNSANIDGKKWTRADTGQRLGGYSASYVDHCFDIILEMYKDDYSECKSVTDAIKVKARIREDAAVQEQLRRTQSSLQPAAAVVQTRTIATPMPCVACEGTGTYYKTGDPCFTCHGTGIVEQYSKQDVPLEVVSDAPIINISETLFNGDCIDILSTFAASTVDHIISDPPYGIDVDMLQQSSSALIDVSRVSATHQVEDNMTLFARMMPLFFRVLKPTGFCCLWCDCMQWDYLYHLAEDAGFKVQRWPHVWCKSSQCKNQMAFLNETKATEFVIILRKPEAKLAQTVMKNYTIANGLDEKLSNPFAKPQEVWIPLIDMISIPGQTILDPFAGEGTCPMACLATNRKTIAIEKELTHYAYMVESFKQFHQNKLGNVSFS